MSYKCYIDESGDEGINTGGSRWFILGALIVRGDMDLKTSEMVPRIKSTLKKEPKWTLHWASIKKHDHKLYVCKELQTEPWEFSCVAGDKIHPSIANAVGLKEKWKLYHYSTRLLLERLSWYARDHGNTKANIIFEHRSNIDYKSMKAYFELLRSYDTQISWENLNTDFRIESKHKSRLLQACDCVCGTLFDALEPSKIGGFTESRYVESLGGRFYRRGGNLFSYGLKLLVGNNEEMQKDNPWVGKL